MSVDEEGVRDLTVGRKPSSEPCSRSRTFKLSELFFVEKNVIFWPNLFKK
jgi:hypothetical protein